MQSVTRRLIRVVQALVLTVLAVQVLAASQGADAKRVLNELRAALGGEDKLSAVKTLAVQGQSARVGPDGSTTSSSDFEWAMELPSKFVKRDMFANLGGQKLYRRLGFNGAVLIEETDLPPGMAGGGGQVVTRVGPGTFTRGGQPNPADAAEQKAQALVQVRREFARLTLGMLGTSVEAFPLEFSYAGQADAPNGKADVLEVRGADGFVAKFFIDGKTRLPLMLSWMDKEPLRMTMGPGGGTMSAGNVQVFSGGGGAVGARSPEEVARMQQEMADRMKEAEAKRRTVEYRLSYSDYKTFNGVRLPTKIQRMMDGLPTEELALDDIKVNSRIDASKFQSSK